MEKAPTYHAVHDPDGNIRSIFLNSSSSGARLMMTPEAGCSVSQVKLHEQRIPGELGLAHEDDANQIRELMRRYRVDISVVGELVEKKTTQG